MSGHVFDARAAIQEGVVLSVDDTGAVQRVSVRTAHGFVFDRVEVAQTFGVATAAPVNGAKVVLLAIGGDPANLRAFPVGNPSRRYGRLEPGEATLYSAGGSRVAVRNGGTIDVHAGTVINIVGPSVTIVATGTVSIAAAGGLHILNDTTITGDLHVTGQIYDSHGSLGGFRDHYNSHRHGGGPLPDVLD
jgi:phage baseplate assembly protein V